MSVMHYVLRPSSVLKGSFFISRRGEKCGAIIILLRFRAAVKIRINGECLGSDQNSFF